MKKVIMAGALFLCLGMASCKTYCPAYNLASVEATEAATTTAPAEGVIAKG